MATAFQCQLVAIKLFRMPHITSTALQVTLALRLIFFLRYVKLVLSIVQVRTVQDTPSVLKFLWVATKKRLAKRTSRCAPRDTTAKTLLDPQSLVLKVPILQDLKCALITPSALTLDPRLN